MRFDEQGRKKSGLSGGGECLGRRRKGEGEGEGERERERERARERENEGAKGERGSAIMI